MVFSPIGSDSLTILILQSFKRTNISTKIENRESLEKVVLTTCGEKKEGRLDFEKERERGAQKGKVRDVD